MYYAAAARTGARAGLVGLGEAERTIHGSAFAQHMPYDGQVGTENAPEGLKDRVCAERDIVPRKVCTAATEDDGKSDGRYDTCSRIGLSQCWSVQDREELTRVQCRR
jgi:hypothetical protein